MDYFSEESFHGSRRPAVIIGFAMLFGVFAYAGIVEFISRSKAPFTGYAPLPAEDFSLLRLLLLGAALVSLAGIPFIRRRILSAQVKAGSPAGTEQSAADRLTAVCVVTLALCESIAIYGLVLFLLNGARQEFYAFFCLSLAAFMVNFPRVERWQEWSRTMKDVRE
jgi:F0F1-type ATP synthase membrane subunit c/vacuolar-type H+-ATPase subunit K